MKCRSASKAVVLAFGAAVLKDKQRRKTIIAAGPLHKPYGYLY